MKDPTKMRWLVAQIGAREHYAFPRAMERVGRLRHLYTDIWVRHGANLLLAMPSSFKGLGGRSTPEIPSEKVTSWSIESMAERGRLFLRRDIDVSEWHANTGKAFAERTVEQIRLLNLSSATDAFLGFTGGSLEVLEHLRVRGITTVVDQIDPGRDDDLLERECDQWRGWEPQWRPRSAKYHARVAAEWREADYILVNSRWSRSSLISQGVPAGKLIVVPLAYNPADNAWKERQTHEGPLRVLFLGNVCLRKGVQYLVEAAKLLGRRSVRVRIVGKSQLDSAVMRTAPANVEFVGHCPRVAVAEEFAQADVFVIPTLSDGFAITQLEAMSAGVPIVATPNCGDVVTDGVDGFLVPARDSRALADRLLLLHQDRGLLATMGRGAREKAKHFGLSSVIPNMDEELKRAIMGTAGSGANGG